MAANYYKLLLAAAKNKPQIDLKSEKWVNLMIKTIQDGKTVKANEGPDKLHPFVKDSLDTYDVLVSQTLKKKLVIKAKGKEPLKYITALEESYAIVSKAHMLTEHGGVDAMSDWLSQSRVIVSDICLPIAVETCKECEMTPETVGLLTIIDMGRILEETIDYLLVYQERDTKYLVLRPFSSVDMVDSLSNEIMQMFSQIFPPQCILIQPALKDIMSCVFNERLHTLFKCKIYLKVDEASDEKVIDDIKARLLAWLSQDSDRTWSIGCFLIQCELNNIPGEDGLSPTEKLLTSCFIKDESNKNIPLSKHSTDLNRVVDNVKVEPEENDIEAFIRNNPVLEMQIKSEIFDTE